MTDAATKNLAAASESTGSTTKAVVVGNLIVNLVLSGSLAMLWGMINALQVIVHLPMLQTSFPANV